jgi:iron complex outermembrane receptor protein
LLGAGCTIATLQTAPCAALRNPAIARDPLSGSVSRVFVNRFNAASAQTDGFDVSVAWFKDTDIGTFGVNNQTTFVSSFELQAVAGGPTVDGAGMRNESSPLANSIPELRSNTSFSWSKDNMAANAIVRYIDDYQETGGTTIDDWIVLDLQYSHRFDMDGSDASVSLGILNATDEEPPAVLGLSNEFGYDTKVHDARGSVWYARFTYTIE